MNRFWPIVFSAVCMLAISCVSAQKEDHADDWHQTFRNTLDHFGHRNWILVVDKAFPEQASAGTQYLYVNDDILPTLQFVLREIEESTHVRPHIYRDLELQYITEDMVDGISTFREESKKVLAERSAETILHADVFRMIKENSSLFSTLIIKTNSTVPYSSFFIQLDCAYWNADQEDKLRRIMDQ